MNLEEILISVEEGANEVKKKTFFSFIPKQLQFERNYEKKKHFVLCYVRILFAVCELR